MLPSILMPGKKDGRLAESVSEIRQGGFAGSIILYGGLPLFVWEINPGMNRYDGGVKGILRVEFSFGSGCGAMKESHITEK